MPRLIVVVIVVAVILVAIWYYRPTIEYAYRDHGARTSDVTH